MVITTLTAVVVMLVVYYVIHLIDRTRGSHLALIEEKLADGSWTTRELVRRGDHLRLVALTWTSNWSYVKRTKILATCDGTLSTREARAYMAASLGVDLRHSHETYKEYVRYTQKYFQELKIV